MDDTYAWWGAHRLRYNVGLVAAGAVAWVLYAFVSSLGPEYEIRPGEIDGPEITVFTTFVQLIGFAMVVGVANVAYLLGPRLERLLKPADVKTYRGLAFGLGFGFSVSLPFVVPALELVRLLNSDRS